jgi:molybdopterin-guanine dinucleotide biosynthesis protein A
MTDWPIIHHPLSSSDCTIKNLKANEQSRGSSPLSNIHLNIEELHNQLYALYEKAVNDIISSKKLKIESRIRDLFASAKREVVAFSAEETS